MIDNGKYYSDDNYSLLLSLFCSVEVLVRHLENDRWWKFLSKNSMFRIDDVDWICSTHDCRVLVCLSMLIYSLFSISRESVSWIISNKTHVLAVSDYWLTLSFVSLVDECPYRLMIVYVLIQPNQWEEIWIRRQRPFFFFMTNGKCIDLLGRITIGFNEFNCRLEETERRRKTTDIRQLYRSKLGRAGERKKKTEKIDILLLMML